MENVKVIKVDDVLVIDDGYSGQFNATVSKIDEKGNIFIINNNGNEVGITESIIKMVNGNYWLPYLNDGNRDIPEINLIIKLWREGKYQNDDVKCFFEGLDFMTTTASRYKSKLVCKLNDQVCDGINELSYENMWVNLSQIAKHAINKAAEVCKKQTDEMHIDMFNHFLLQNDFLNAGISDYPEIIKRMQNIYDDEMGRRKQ